MCEKYEQLAIHFLNIIITKPEWCRFGYKHWCTTLYLLVYNLSKFKKRNWTRSTKCFDWKIKKLGLMDIWSCFWGILFLKILNLKKNLPKTGKYLSLYIHFYYCNWFLYLKMNMNCIEISLISGLTRKKARKTIEYSAFSLLVD